MAALNRRRAAAGRQAMTDIAEEMANGCPSVAEAARRMRLSQTYAAKLWSRIVAELGPQAT